MLYREGHTEVSLRARKRERGAWAIWCAHGFGASGASFLEAFDAPELQAYSLFVPDFPGFGDSPEGGEPQGIAEASALLLRLIASYSEPEPVVLLGHSAGGLIATEVARELPQVRGYVNIEGNITKADVFFSGEAAHAGDIEDWRQRLADSLASQAGEDEATRRYCRDLLKAAPRTLKKWATSTVEKTGETKAGERFAEIACPKLYIYGVRSASQPALDFLRRNSIPCLGFNKSGHSPMIDEVALFYQTTAEFIASCGH